MSYGLSFSAEFFIAPGDDFDSPPPVSNRPTSVLQGIVSMGEDDWREYCETVLGVDPHAEAALGLAMEKVREVNSCSNLNSPVKVWLDPEGWWFVRVYNSPR